MPMLKFIYEHKRLTIAEAVTRREFFIHLGKLLTIIISLVFNYSLIIPIILAGVASLVFNFVKEDA